MERNHPVTSAPRGCIAPRILRLVQITGLTKVLAIQPSVAEAITADPHWQHTAETESGSVPLWCQQHGLS